ncbi:MAG: DUF4350 domain-containing protein [Pseudomonadota bacterium]
MRPMTIGLLVVLMLSLLAGWWFQNFESVEQTRWVGYSGEASYNQFYAAEALLREQGIESDSQATLTPASWLPATSDTIVVASSASLSTPTQINELLGWVFSGGHLVVLPPMDDSDSDWLRDAFGMAFVELEDPEFAEDTSADADGEDDSPDADVDYLLQLGSTRYRIELTDAADATLSDDEGVVIARRGVQDGVITLVGSEYYFANGQLNEDDHARLLLDIVAGYYDSGRVWFIYSADFDSLFEMLWDNFPRAVSLFLLLLLAWILSSLPRFGPPLADSPPERRSVTEHVRAAGLFDWRSGRAEGLARSAIDALLHDAEYRHPGIGRLSPEKQAKRLAAITGMSADSVLQALMLRDEDNPRQFTQHMKTLQTTRDRL